MRYFWVEFNVLYPFSVLKFSIKVVFFCIKLVLFLEKEEKLSYTIFEKLFFFVIRVLVAEDVLLFFLDQIKFK
mgnify:CR=1 FL=1